MDLSSVPPIPPYRYWYQTDHSYWYQADDSYRYRYCSDIYTHTDTGISIGLIPIPGTGWPKKSIPLFGVSGGTQVFANQLDRHIFGFPTKILTIFKDFIVRKKDICNSAVISPTALLQMSFVEIILRLFDFFLTKLQLHLQLELRLVLIYFYPMNTHPTPVLPKRSAKEALGLHCRLFWYLGPHLVRIGVKKWAFLPPGIKKADIYGNLSTIFIL